MYYFYTIVLYYIVLSYCTILLYYIHICNVIFSAVYFHYILYKSDIGDEKVWELAAVPSFYNCRTRGVHRWGKCSQFPLKTGLESRGRTIHGSLRNFSVRASRGNVATIIRCTWKEYNRARLYSRFYKLESAAGNYCESYTTCPNLCNIPCRIRTFSANIGLWYFL